MKHLALVAAAILGIESAAFACSCLATDDPVELRRLAAETAPNAVALVEVETVLPYAESNGAGDRMRVIRTLAGTAAAEFRVARGAFPSSASCDLLFDKGQRDVVLLYPASGAAATEPTYRISGLCTAHLLDNPIFRDEVARLMAGLPGERG